MYSEVAIDNLKNRIGWSDYLDLPVTILDSVSLPTSTKKVSFYHQLVSLKNLFYTIPEETTQEDAFNEFLDDLKLQAVLTAITDVLEKHPDYVYTASYDQIILENQNLFDDVVGYLITIKSIELFMSSSRSNYTERNVKLSYQNLKIELEGLKNESGHQIAFGLNYKLRKAIENAQNVIFPIKPIVDTADIW